MILNIFPSSKAGFFSSPDVLLKVIKNCEDFITLSTPAHLHIRNMTCQGVPQVDFSYPQIPFDSEHNHAKQLRINIQ